MVEACLAAIPKLAPLVTSSGQLKDAEIAAALGPEYAKIPPPCFREGSESQPKRKRKELHEMAINRRRALLLSHATILRTKEAVTEAEEPEDEDEVRSPKNCVIRQDGGEIQQRHRGRPRARIQLEEVAAGPAAPARVQPVRRSAMAAGSLLSYLWGLEVDGDDSDD